MPSRGCGAVFIANLQRQLFRRHGPAAVRDRAAAAMRAGVPRWQAGAADEREILVNVTPRETRAALVENGALQELYIERASRRGLVSNLYKGRVSRVLPGMQAAFVDIGLERTAFLHAADIARAGPADAESGSAAASRTSARWCTPGRGPPGAGAEGSARHARARG